MWLKNLEVIAFGGLGKDFNSSLVAEKAMFQQLNGWTQDKGKPLKAARARRIKLTLSVA